MRFGNSASCAVFALLAMVALIRSLAAQGMAAPPNALQGFSVNREKPVQITSATLEVRDKEKRATFLGNVVVVQGDTTMKSRTLDVYYDQEGDAAETKGAQPGPPGQQQIRRLEAKGSVVVTQKDQTATGEMGIFDMRANTVTLLGGVVITQGPQVIKGERLVVDLTSGVSHVEGGVGAVFHPNKARADAKLGDARSSDNKPAEARAGETRPGEARSDSGRGRESGRPAAKSGQPLKLN